MGSSAQTHVASSLPTGLKQKLERLACNFIEKKFPEGVIAGDICENLKEKIKFLPEAPCETVVDRIYGYFESKCPAPAPNYTAQTRMASSLPSGLKQELERLPCHFIEKKFPEGVIAGDICEHLKEKVKFLPEAPCETVVDKIYGYFESKCPAPAPNSSVQTGEALNSPSGLKQDLERLACNLIEKKFPEG